MAGYQGAVKSLGVADALDRCKFQIYGECRKKLAMEIECGLAEYDLNQLRQDLNEAVDPVLAKWRDAALNKVRSDIGAQETA